jgi:hypothetical protein
MANVPTTSERNCLDYGFTVGGVARDRCVKSLDEAARNACADHGLLWGTSLCEQCVSREIDGRRYREITPYEPVSAPNVNSYTDATGDEAFGYECAFPNDIPRAIGSTATAASSVHTLHRRSRRTTYRERLDSKKPTKIRTATTKLASLATDEVIEL